MVLSRTGPALWLTIQIFAWGTVATAQAAVRNLAGFYASRFFLGMWEAGYLAASLSILATFYTRREMAMRVTMVYIGNYFSAGTGGLIAGAVFKIPESTGLKQWQVSTDHFGRVSVHLPISPLRIRFLIFHLHVLSWRRQGDPTNICKIFPRLISLESIVALPDQRPIHLPGGYSLHPGHAAVVQQYITFMRSSLPRLLQRRRPPHLTRPRHARRPAQAGAAQRYHAQAGSYDPFQQLARLGPLRHQRCLVGAQGRPLHILTHHYQESGL